VAPSVRFELVSGQSGWQDDAAMPDEGIQGEFVFVDGWPGGGAGPLPPTLDEEIAAAWQVPIGKRVHVTLRRHDVAGTTGRLEIARAPDWPFDPHQPLALRIGHVAFTHQQIESWALL
jgi:hypothetical protein